MRLALKEEKIVMEEYSRVVEQEKKLFFMDTSKLDERKMEYVNLCRAEVLPKKRMIATTFAPPMSGFGGFGGIRGMGGMGAYGGFGGMGGMSGMGNLRKALHATTTWDALEALEL
jgi:hypothetical protein